MARIRSMASSLASPAVLMVIVWLFALALILIGPISYPDQPSLSALAIIAGGLCLFLGGHVIGVRLSSLRPNFSCVALPWSFPLDKAIGSAAVLGILGIALIEIDRQFLSGVGGSKYAAFLRCAPEFIEAIQIQRTPLIYAGYLLFSFGFASIALFVLRGEEIRGWPAYLAQISIISPVGYALIYSGRMPIFFVLTMLLAVGIIRLHEGRSLLPGGHHLVLKGLIFIVMFAAYVNVTWTTRLDFCLTMNQTVQQLRQDLAAQRQKNLAQSQLRQELAAQRQQVRSKDKEPTAVLAAPVHEARTTEPMISSGDTEPMISSGDVVEMLEQAKVRAHTARSASDVERPGVGKPASQFVQAVMQEAWGVKPRGYLLTLVEHNIISPRMVIVIASNYFYLTHGIMILDRIWRGQQHLTPVWGVYEIGVFSPVIRVFFAESSILRDMNQNLRSADIYGFFPTSWGAAYVDFGVLGGGLYLLLWGLMGGWAYHASRHTKLATAPLLLSFVLATVLLSPLQGPLGIANSALVLVSMIVLGLVIDMARTPREVLSTRP
jgi:molybdopterin converting factor small subunit